VSEVLRIGSRGSKLALIQAQQVCHALASANAGLALEIVPVSTTGDKLLDTPLAKIGDRGLFVKELETALLEGRVDVAVHSAKDLPTELPQGLGILAFTERADVRDVFVAGPGVAAAGLGDLSQAAQVASSSLRRRSQLLARRPDLQIVDIRGNVETRLRKLAELRLAGTVLAAAGLGRLGLDRLAAFRFALDDMLPAVGQGALALEGRADDARVRGLVGPLDHRPTALAVRAERALMRTLQGGCQVPIAALGGLCGDTAGGAAGAADEDGVGVSAAGERGELRLRAFVGSLDGRESVVDELAGPASDPEGLGRALAARLLAAGGERILACVRAGG
jgi:hydroxymethylbilane synthase